MSKKHASDESSSEVVKLLRELGPLRVPVHVLAGRLHRDVDELRSELQALAQVYYIEEDDVVELRFWNVVIDTIYAAKCAPGKPISVSLLCRKHGVDPKAVKSVLGHIAASSDRAGFLIDKLAETTTYLCSATVATREQLASYFETRAIHSIPLDTIVTACTAPGGIYTLIHGDERFKITRDADNNGILVYRHVCKSHRVRTDMAGWAEFCAKTDIQQPVRIDAQKMKRIVCTYTSRKKDDLWYKTAKRRLKARARLQKLRKNKIY